MSLRSTDSPEEVLAYSALFELAAEDLRYEKNKEIFVNWDSPRRLKWIAKLQDQATLGLPLAVAMIGKMAALRLKS